jgi:hypothetical protein
LQENKEFPQFLTIQNSIFPADVPVINYNFDLKGSTHNRLITNSKDDMDKLKNGQKNGQEPTWMDQNFVRFEIYKGLNAGFFPNGIQIDEVIWKKLNEIIEKDSKVPVSNYYQ